MNAEQAHSTARLQSLDRELGKIMVKIGAQAEQGKFLLHVTEEIHFLNRKKLMDMGYSIGYDSADKIDSISWYEPKREK